MSLADLFRLERYDVEELVESPIERRMLDVLQDICPHRILPKYFQVRNLEEARQVIARRGFFLESTCLVFPQINVLRYRLDFLVAYGTRSIPISDELFEPVVFALECDGKEYHQDLARDRRRDAEIMAGTGVPTVRVAGSDIYRRPGRVLFGLTRMLRAIEKVQLARCHVRDAPDHLGNEDADPWVLYEMAKNRVDGLRHWYGWDWELWAMRAVESGEPGSDFLR